MVLGVVRGAVRLAGAGRSAAAMRLVARRGASAERARMPRGVRGAGAPAAPAERRDATAAPTEDLFRPTPAQQLIAEVPPVEVDGRIAVCDGGGGSLGHPKVYMNLDRPGPHGCSYCGLRFVMKKHEH